MSKQKVTRRLAAILAADVVGYSRLVRADEDGTLARLKALRDELIDPSISRHDGRIVKTMGDGVLVEFSSVVDAVRSAVEVQQSLAEREADVPEDRRIVLRVGINLGDVVIDGDDIHGDGVNVAARLEGLAMPGSICVSGAVHDQVRDRIDLYFEDLGEQEVKNIDRPIQVWRWTPEPSVTADEGAVAAKPLPLPDKPSIAVLPFENMSGDPEQEHFADGMAEDITTSLSRMPWFFVIARNSSFTYKGRAVDVTKVAAELGVKYVLEGSVRKGGNRLRITAQLIDAKTGNHIWAERYDRELIDIFEVQDEVTQAIVAAVAPEFLSTEAKAARRKDPAHLDAWECVMRGRAHLWKLGREDAAEARQLFERAIELAPGGEFGASDLALVHFLEFFYGWGDSPEQSLKNMLATAQMAIAADGSDALAWTVLAWASQFAHRWDDAIEAIERAIQLSPNFVPAIGIRGGIRALNGEPDSAIESINQAARLSPSDGFMPIWMLCLFWAYYAKGQYDEAAKAALRGLRTAPDNPTLRRQLAAAYAMLDRMDEAKAALDEYLRIEPNHTIADARRIPSSVPDDLERYLDGLRKAGLPE
jgi:adenylate cyclase